MYIFKDLNLYRLLHLGCRLGHRLQRYLDDGAGPDGTGEGSGSPPSGDGRRIDREGSLGLSHNKVRVNPRSMSSLKGVH